ncbi:MarR family transcriptional regulator [Dyella jiangningensis]|jgi:DNA-binding MarR family transcriptional regulator|uniref:MarR family winged helix-turn-helix transcriptional regulator n=1 Tax=Dyella jiangningensis TaxID=1379159 RepID=UPI0004563A21|nr:MarR family transcriptional regulator [Dyella jiangningensis]AHX12442.1 MarR family transcriptional regulator [Dyella jiangningensis]MDG2537340.1 MarR family transcriptional regulator [Dyella jiangningensis]
MKRKPTPEHLLLDQQLCFALYAASRSVTGLYRPLLEPLGLTYPQYLVMLVLWEQDGLTVRELGQRLQLDSGTLTPLLKRLQTAGLVDRQRRTEDEREVDIRLTEAGLALRDQASDVPKCMAQRLQLSLEQMQTLRDELKRMTRQLQLSPTED